MSTALEMASKEAADWHAIYMAEKADHAVTAKLFQSTLERLREIANLAGTTKRKQAGCEMAASWLYAHGYALLEGGYLPGVGFEDGAENMLRRRQAE